MMTPNSGSHTYIAFLHLFLCLDQPPPFHPTTIALVLTGGVTSMDDFLIKFFPKVYRRKTESKDSNYCKYDNQGLQLFTSSLYLAGLTATFFASYTTRNLGRKHTMLIAGIFFLVGVILNGAAQDLPMLIIGRILLGCGVGFANQVSPPSV